MLDNSQLISKLAKLRQTHLSAIDWKREQLNFVPLRGSWFAQSEADFSLEDEIDKFLGGDKKVLLLLGDSGAGKSLYTQGLAIKLWQAHDSTKPIPLWISLPALKDPVNHAIEETLANYGFTPEQLETLKRTQRFIFILDAYDEIRQFKNLYVSNHLDQWQCQIIITCRREYLYREYNYQLYFKPFQGERPLHTAYDEIVIRPFNTNQITAFIKQYVAQQDTLWKEAERYEKAIEEIPGLKNLITSPFMLKLTMEVLPQIVERYQSQSLTERRNLTQAALYDVFIEQWFVRQEQKLKDAGQIKADEDIKSEFWAYAKALAQAMHERNVTQVHYEVEDTDLYGEVADENPWKRFFDLADKRVGLLQTACLIRQVSPHHYAFIHASLLEYFLTRNLYEHIMQQGSVSQQTISTSAVIAAAGSGVAESSPVENVESPPSKWQQDYFNQRLIVNEPGTLQFLVDRVEEKGDYKQSLFDRVYASRNNPAMKVAAANAITILNRALIPFSGLNLSDIQIPNANLSYGMLHYTNLSNADLNGVCFIQTCLSYANLTGSQVKKIDFGQLAMLEEENEIDVICYSPDGHRLMINKCYDMTMWLIKKRSPHVHVVRHVNDVVESAAFSPDGKILAIGVSNSIRRCDVFLWNVLTVNNIGKEIKRFAGHTKSVTSVAFNYNGELLVSGSADKTLRIWDVKNQRSFGQPLIGHNGKINCVAFSPDGKIVASVSDDKTLRLWYVESQRPFGEPLKHHKGKISCVAFAPKENILASVGDDGFVHLWGIIGTKIYEQTIQGHKGRINCVSFNMTGSVLATGGDDKTIFLWSVKKLCAIGQPLEGHKDKVTCIAFDPSENILASGSHDKTVRLWKLQEYELSADNKINAAPIDNKNTIDVVDLMILIQSYRKTKLLRLLGMQLPRSHTASYPYVTCANFNSTGSLMATGTNTGLIRLWNIYGEEKLKSVLEGHTGRIISVAFSSDSKLLASGADDNTIRLWNLSVGTSSILQLGYGLNKKQLINNVIFSPDSALLLNAAGDSFIRSWNVETLESKIIQLREANAKVYDIKYGQSGSLLVCVNLDYSFQVLDINTQKAFTYLQSDAKDKKCWAVISPNSKFLISSDDFYTLKVLMIRSPEFIQIETFQRPIKNTYFNFDGNYIIIQFDIGFALLAYQENQRYYYTLIWSSFPMLLSGCGLNLINAKCLSDANKVLLMQLGAMFHQNDLDFNNERTFFNCGVANTKLGRYKEAIDDYNNALRLTKTEERKWIYLTHKKDVEAVIGCSKSYQDSCITQQTIEEIPVIKDIIAQLHLSDIVKPLTLVIWERYKGSLQLDEAYTSKSVIYDLLIRIWFTKYEQKLKSTGQIEADTDITSKFWEYAKAIAQMMHEHNITQVIYEEGAGENPWKKFFDSKDPNAVLLQAACLMTEVSPHHFAFIHESFLEYFLSMSQGRQKAEAKSPR